MNNIVDKILKNINSTLWLIKIEDYKQNSNEKVYVRFNLNALYSNAMLSTLLLKSQNKSEYTMQYYTWIQ